MMHRSCTTCTVQPCARFVRRSFLPRKKKRRGRVRMRKETPRGCRWESSDWSVHSKAMSSIAIPIRGQFMQVPLFDSHLSGWSVFLLFFLRVLFRSCGVHVRPFCARTVERSKPNTSIISENASSMKSTRDCASFVCRHRNTSTHSSTRLQLSTRRSVIPARGGGGGGRRRRNQHHLNLAEVTCRIQVSQAECVLWTLDRPVSVFWHFFPSLMFELKRELWSSRHRLPSCIGRRCETSLIVRNRTCNHPLRNRMVCTFDSGALHEPFEPQEPTLLP